MSQQLPPDAAGQPGQPSEEEVRQYVAQMRGAPVEQIVVELVQGLLNAAQMKLGRNDGRLLIDTTAALMQQVGPHVADELTSQVQEALTQLRTHQVEAEKEVAAAGEPEPNDLPDRPGAGQQASGQQPGQQGSPQGGQSAAGSKLWVPGR